MFIKQKGFSLLELIIVIVIIGVLAVVALPRLLDTVSGARKSSVEAVASGYAAGVLSARAQWEAEARPSITVDGEKYNTVNYDGTNFWLTSSTAATVMLPDFKMATRSLSILIISTILTVLQFSCALI